MSENEKLEEIFDRYVGLELLSSSWPPTPRSAGAPGASYVHVAVEEGPSQFWEDALLRDVVDAA